MKGRCFLFGRPSKSLSFGLVFLLLPSSLVAEPLQALSKIDPGLWDIRSTDARDGGQTMCVADPVVLLQLAHPGLACSRFPIENAPQAVTVHYRCPAAGSGQTRLRVETPRLVQIETQGIVRNAPFSMTYEARRLGPCAPPRK